MNIYISVVVWGMHEQYACAVLIEWCQSSLELRPFMQILKSPWKVWVRG